VINNNGRDVSCRPKAAVFDDIPNL